MCVACKLKISYWHEEILSIDVVICLRDRFGVENGNVFQGTCTGSGKTNMLNRVEEIEYPYLV